jgi:hypothetical protein
MTSYRALKFYRQQEYLEEQKNLAMEEYYLAEQIENEKNDLLKKSWKNDTRMYPKDSDTPKQSQSLIEEEKKEKKEEPYFEIKVNISNPLSFFDYHDEISKNRRRQKLKIANMKLKKVYKKRKLENIVLQNKKIFDDLMLQIENQKDEDFDEEKPILYDLNDEEEDEEEKEYDFESNQNSFYSKKSSLKSDLFENFSSDMF